ncbi:MAG TPA: hypothetical protein VFG04_12995 [Planctomycetaceae bacterium]|jgi:hypothetical protein|nr:hypothetical protein [Planctomycetaceae bacterium]
MASQRFWIVLVLLCFSMTGCGRPGPLVIDKKQPDYAPWCGPNRRVQIGQRVVGQVHDGPKHRQFLLDDTGKEHDPERIAEQVWAYLERTGDARKIAEAFGKEAYVSTMPVVSINPIVVILETHQDAAWLKQPREMADKAWYWRAQIQPNSNPRFSDGLQWFSSELKQKPTRLEFSKSGIAEIALPNGTLKLIREGDKCKTMRE